MMKSAAVWMVAALFGGVPAWAAEPGTTALAFLKLTTGARPLAMGEAFVGVADDVNAVYANPAGLGNLSGIQAQFTHHAHFEQISHEVLTATYELKDVGRFGINAALLFVNDMKKTLADSAGNYAGEAGTFSARDMAITLAYGRPLLMPGLTVGAGAKVLSETIDSAGAFSFAVDLGAHYKTKIEGLDAGLVIQNLGAPIQQDPLPLIFKAGVGYKKSLGEKIGEMREGIGQVSEHSVLGAADLSVPMDNTPAMSLGGEYAWRGMIMARVGFRAGPNLRDLGASSGLTAGLGVRFRMAALDFGYQGYGDLGPTVRVSLGLRL